MEWQVNRIIDARIGRLWKMHVWNVKHLGLGPGLHSPRYRLEYPPNRETGTANRVRKLYFSYLSGLVTTGLDDSPFPSWLLPFCMSDDLRRLLGRKPELSDHRHGQRGGLRLQGRRLYPFHFDPIYWGLGRSPRDCQVDLLS